VKPDGNSEIDQGTRASVGRLLEVLDPKAQKADDLGLWLPTGDHVYLEHLDPKRNLVAPPTSGDITEDFLRRKLGARYKFLGGADFNGYPHHAVVIFRVYGSIERPIFHAVDEVITPPIGSQDTTATEEELLHDLEAAGYDHSAIAVIGDASGQQQDGKHSGPQRTSYSVFQSYRFRIVPPVEKKSDKGQWSRNPPIEDRLNTVNKLLAEGRFLVDPVACPWLVESLKKCPMRTIDGRRKPYGRHTHVTDAAGYALLWGEPAPRAPMHSWPGGKIPVHPVPKPKGIRIL